MKPEDVKYEVTLTKSETFKLRPFGYFLVKFIKHPHLAGARTIPAMEMKMEHETSFPLGDKEDEFIKQMKKYKTDIFTDGGYFNFYTRTGSGMTRVYHPKLQAYREDEGGFRAVVDGDRETQI
jgi:hypothetical protein